MFHSKQAAFGLYFDSKNVYVAEIEGTYGKSGQPRLAQEKIPPHASDTPSKNAAYQKAIRQAIQKAGIQSTHAVLALPGAESIVRYFELPHISKKDLPDAVRFEAQKYMPFETRDLDYDFEVFPDADSKKLNIVFIAAKKETVEGMQKIFSEMGLALDVVEPDALSLLRFFYKPSSKKGEVSAFVSVHQDGGVDVVIEKNRMILMTRSSTPIDAILDFEALMKEVDVSFNYFSKNFKTEEIMRITLLAGAGSEAKSWVEGMKTRFEVPVEQGPLEGSLCAVHGAALAEPARHPFSAARRANLLPQRAVSAPGKKITLPPAEEKKFLQKWALIDVAIVAGIFMLAHLLFLPKTYSMSRSLASLDRGYPQTASAVPSQTADELNEVIAQLSKKVGFFSALVDQRIYCTTKLGRLALDVPKDIQLTQMEFSHDEDKTGRAVISLKIQGNAAPRENGDEIAAVQELVDALRQDKEFMQGLDSVKISSVRRQTNPRSDLVTPISFTVECFPSKKQESGVAG